MNIKNFISVSYTCFCYSYKKYEDSSKVTYGVATLKIQCMTANMIANNTKYNYAISVCE